MNFKTVLLSSAACALLCGPAFAQDNSGAPTAAPPKHHRHADPSVGARLDHLERVIEEQQEEIHQLKTQLGRGGPSGGATSSGTATANEQPAPQPEVTAAQFEALQNQVYEQAAATKGQATVKIAKGRPTISSPDGKWTFSPRVDVMGDFGAYDSGTVAGIALKRNGENFRRAQIGFQGTFAGDFGYKFIYDFGGTNGDETYQSALCYTSPTSPKLCTTGAGSGPHIQSAWVSYTGVLAPFTFQIGALPPPSNLADATAADDLLFNERASPAQLSRALGGDDGRESVGFIGSGSIWNASAFFTGDTVGKADLIAPGSGQEAVVGRVAVAPWQDPDTNFNVHLGANGTEVVRPQESTAISSTTGLGTTGDFITFSDRPELRVDNITFLNTGAINAQSAYAVGLEGAVSYGPVLVEGENFWYGVDRQPNSGKTNPNFSGWYVEGSWVLTGEPRKYSMASASFTRPSPDAPFNPSNGAWGAWEVAGRYSSTDLNYDEGLKDAVYGGNQDIWSVGLNFYPIDNLKFMFDWQSVKLSDIGKLGNGGNYNALSFRTQVTF